MVSDVPLMYGIVAVGGLAVGAFDLVNRSLPVVRFVLVSVTLVSKCCSEVIGLWATRML